MGKGNRIDSVIPKKVDRLQYLKYKLENGQLFRQYDQIDNGIISMSTFFQEDINTTPLVGDEAIRLTTVDCGNNDQSTNYELVVLTQEIIDCTDPIVNLPPTDISLSNVTVPEVSPIGFNIGTLGASDPNPFDNHTFTIVLDPDDKFFISGNILRLNNLVDFDTKPTHEVTIRATDQGSLFFDKLFTIIVTEQIGFDNEKATLFLGNTVDNYIKGKPTSDVLSGNGSFSAVDWIKKDNPQFLPSSIPNLKLWLDADDNSSIIKDVNDFVSQWNDKSGNSNNAIQSVLADRPLYTLSSMGIKPSLVFDGINDFMEVPDTGTLAGDNPYTMFVIFQEPVQGNGTSLSQSVFGIGEDIGGTRTAATLAFESSISTAIRRLGGNTVFNTSLSVNTPTLVSVKYSSGGLADVLRVDKSVQTILSQVNGAYNFLNGKMKIGISSSISWLDTFEGNIAEVLFYNRDLTSQELDDVETYLDEKWINPTVNTSVPTDFSDLEVWLDADDNDTRVIDSGTLLQWKDKSGKDNHADQPTLSLRPIVQSNGYGSRSTILFDGIDDFMVGSNISASTTETTVFIVSKFNQLNQGSSDFDYIYSLGVQTSLNMQSLSRRAGGSQADEYYMFNGSVALSGPLLIGQQFQIHTQRVNSAAIFHEYFIDGIAQSVTDSAGQITINGPYNLGRYFPNNHFLDGEIAEIIIYRRALNNTERLAVEDYLNSKWVLGINQNELKTIFSLKQSSISGKIKAELMWDEQSILKASIYDSNTDTIKLINVNGSFSDNVYHQVILEYNFVTSISKLFVDSIEVGSVSVVASASGDGLITLGTSFETPPYLDALMDEFSLWNIILDKTETYNNGLAYDLTTHSQASGLRNWSRLGDSPDDYITIDGIKDRSGTGYDFTAVNMSNSNCVTDAVPVAPSYSNTKKLGLDGISQYVDTGVSSPVLQDGDFTLILWYNGTAPNYIASQAKTLVPYASAWIIGGGGALFWVSGTTLGTLASISDGNLHSIIFSWNNTTSTFEGFLDGSSIGVSSVVPSVPGADSNIVIGTRGDATSAFTSGDMDEIGLLIGKRINATEATELYNGGVPIDLQSSSLSAFVSRHYRCGEDLGDNLTTMIDQSSNGNATLFNYITDPYKAF